MLEAGIVNLVMANAAVAAICTAGGFGASLPKDQPMPSWTYISAGDRGDYGLRGEHGLVVRRMEIDCYGKTEADAQSLGSAIDRVLSGYHGTLTDADSTQVDAIFHLTMIDFGLDEIARTYRRMLEYRIQYYLPY